MTSEIEALKARIEKLEGSKKNVIQIVLDRSGSMAQIWPGVVSGFNEFINGQKEFEDTTVSLTVFDVAIDTIFEDVPVTSVKKLGAYKKVFPRGMTALYDAIGTAVKTVEKIGHNGKTVFVIYTDGLENSSHEYTRETIFDLISRHRKSDDWQFVFLGANQDAYAVGVGLGVAAGSTFTYAYNSGAAGQSLGGTTTSATQDYLRGTTPDVDLGQNKERKTPSKSSSPS